MPFPYGPPADSRGSYANHGQRQQQGTRITVPVQKPPEPRVASQLSHAERRFQALFKANEATLATAVQDRDPLSVFPSHSHLTDVDAYAMYVLQHRQNAGNPPRWLLLKIVRCKRLKAAGWQSRDGQSRGKALGLPRLSAWSSFCFPVFAPRRNRIRCPSVFFKISQRSWSAAGALLKKHFNATPRHFTSMISNAKFGSFQLLVFQVLGPQRMKPFDGAIAPIKLVP